MFLLNSEKGTVMIKWNPDSENRNETAKRKEICDVG